MGPCCEGGYKHSVLYQAISYSMIYHTNLGAHTRGRTIGSTSNHTTLQAQNTPNTAQHRPPPFYGPISPLKEPPKGTYYGMVESTWNHQSIQKFLKAPNLNPNIYELYTINKIGAHRTDPTRVKGAHNKGP